LLAGGTGSTAGVNFVAGAVGDGTGVQLAPSINSNTKRIIAAFIIMPTVQNMPTGIIRHQVTALQGVIAQYAGEGKSLPEPFIVSFNWNILHFSSFCYAFRVEQKDVVLSYILADCVI
jgi:hypothetical protein